MSTSPTSTPLTESQLGPAERLLDLVLNSSAHLWHNRPGLNVEGVWQFDTRRLASLSKKNAAPGGGKKAGKKKGNKANSMARAPAGAATAATRAPAGAARPAASAAGRAPVAVTGAGGALKKKGKERWEKVAPGLFGPAAESLYGKLLDIYQLNAELMAHFASYVLKETEWRDLKVACSALMLVQPHAGQPIRDEQGAVAFLDDDHREIGEAMLLFYEPKAAHMMTPKGILRVAELLELPGIATLNRAAGFGDANSKHAPLGRWTRAAQHWLRARERNPRLLEGLVKAGYKETLKKIARKCGYKPETQAFFEVLGWKQKQAAAGHRTVGLTDLHLARRSRFDGLSEEQICEQIVTLKLSYKEVVGRLPKSLGLTPAIMVTLFPSLSDRDLRILTPTLEQLGLLKEPEIRTRWERAVATATDQRSLNIAKNVKSKDLRGKLEEASDNAARKAVTEAVADVDVHVMFLVDKSGSMQGAIEHSKEALSRILAGFPMEKLHIGCFDTMGMVLRPKAPNRAAVQHMLSGLHASGGTIHGAAVRALAKAGLKIPKESRLVVIIVGDEAGETGAELAKAFDDAGLRPSAFAIMLNIAPGGQRGHSIRGCAAHLRIPIHEITIEQFADPYQVPRVLKMLFEGVAPQVEAGAGNASGWVEKVMATPLLRLAAVAQVAAAGARG